MINLEIKIIVNIIAFSILFFSTWDLYILIKNKFIKKRFLNIFFDLLFILITIYITYTYTYLLASGYIPQLFIVFLILGYLVYYLFLRKKYLLVIDKILSFLSYLLNYIRKFLRPVFYSKKLLFYLKMQVIKIFIKKNIKNE